MNHIPGALGQHIVNGQFIPCDCYKRPYLPSAGVIRVRKAWPWYVEYPAVLGLAFGIALVIGLIGLTQT